MKINLKKLYGHAIVPTRGSVYAAGYDLYACMSGRDAYRIAPHSTFMIGTGISVAIPSGYFGAVFARSGLASKRGLRPANCVGVIDADYRGEIMVAMYNDSNEPQYFKSGDRIAQLVILPCFDAEFIETDDLDATERGDGGFGSTGSAEIFPNLSKIVCESIENSCKQTSMFDCNGEPIYYDAHWR